MLALSAFGLLPAGCLVADAPDYGPARQTAPVVEAISPSPFLQFEVDFVTPKPVNLVVTSEDAGEELTVAYYVDYGTRTPKEAYIDDFDVAPRPFDQPKTVYFPFAPTRGQVTPGCHTLTVLLMHARSFDSVANAPIVDDDRVADDLTMVTWFFWAKDTANPGAPAACPGGPDPRGAPQ